jgi:hypothetical protein
MIRTFFDQNNQPHTLNLDAVLVDDRPCISVQSDEHVVQFEAPPMHYLLLDRDEAARTLSVAHRSSSAASTRAVGVSEQPELVPVVNEQEWEQVRPGSRSSDLSRLSNAGYSPTGRGISVWSMLFPHGWQSSERGKFPIEWMGRCQELMAGEENNVRKIRYTDRQQPNSNNKLDDFCRNMRK